MPRIARPGYFVRFVANGPKEKPRCMVIQHYHATGFKISGTRLPASQLGQPAQSVSQLGSVQEPREFLAAAWLLQLANRLGFDLADALTGHFENVSHFF